MDINLHTEVKSYGIPPATTTESEDRNRAPVGPVTASEASTGSKPEDRSRFDQQQAGSREKKPLNREQAEQLVDEMQKRLDSIGNTRLLFSLNDDPEAVVIQVTDKKSGEIVRQIPTEESLKIRSKIDELLGMLFDGKA